jgi:lysophospholipase L1-like esterase
VTASGAEGAGPAPTEADWVTDRKAYAAQVLAIHERGRGTVRPGVYLFAGDSITAATLYARTMISWLGRGLMVRQGVGQITTEYGAAHIREYLASAAPEFALVMYGTNDSKSGRAVSGAMRNLASIVDACIERGTIPILATIPPRGYSKGGQGEQERFNQALVELARQKKVPVSYAFEEMMQRDLRQILYDGIHLEPRRGNEAAAVAFRRTMDQVYFALRDTSGGW